MNPDLLIALHDLDDRTPAFFVDEMWVRGDPRVIDLAKWILSSLNERPAVVAVLRSKLQIDYVVGGDD